MKLLAKAKQLFLSKTLNFLFGLAGVFIGVYGIWFYKARPQLVFDVLSDTKVLDVHESIGKLDIVYAGTSLKETGRELRVVSVRISNSGDAPIFRESFDPKEPLALSIINGDLVEPPTVSASSPYLSRNAISAPGIGNSVSLQPVIIEDGEWIDLKLLVALPAGESLRFAPTGKIAGIKKLQLVTSAQDRLEPPLWNRLVGADSLWVQLGRAPIYFLGFIVLLFATAITLVGVFSVLAWPFDKVREMRGRRRRNNLVETYRKTRDIGPTDHLVADEYLQMGALAIPWMKRKVAAINEYASLRSGVAEAKKLLASNFEHAQLKQIVMIRDVESAPRYEAALSRGLQKISDGIPSLPPALLKSIEDFETFLVAHGEEIPKEVREPDVDDIPPDFAISIGRMSRPVHRHVDFKPISTEPPDERS